MLLNFDKEAMIKHDKETNFNRKGGCPLVFVLPPTGEKSIRLLASLLLVKMRLVLI